MKEAPGKGKGPRGDVLRVPEDIDSERILLATVAAPGGHVAGVEALQFLAEEDFSHPGNTALFRAIRSIVESGGEPSFATIKAAMEADGTFQKFGGREFIVEVLQCEEVRDPMVLARQIRDRRVRRDLQKLGGGLVRSAADMGVPTETLVNESFQSLVAMAAGSGKSKGLVRISKSLPGVVDGLVERANGETEVYGIRTCLTGIDERSGGFKPGQLIVVAARPGIGKTAMALNWLYNSSRRYGTRGAFFSLEMSEEEVLMRLLAIHGRVEHASNRRLAFNPKDLGRRGANSIALPVEDQVRLLREARDALGCYPIWINDQASITTGQIRAMVQQRIAAEGDLDWVFVDYLQLVTSNGKRQNDNESIRIGEISRDFKLMAKDLGLTFVVMSQLNREIEGRQGGRPQLSDLRSSGAIEQDADAVIFIHGKTVPGPDGVVPPDREAIIAKMRNGPTGLDRLIFEGEYQCFFEAEERYVEASRPSDAPWRSDLGDGDIPQAVAQQLGISL